MLKKFGKVVLDYFLINYPNTYSFKLSVDDYTFSEFALMSGFEEDKKTVETVSNRFTEGSPES